MLLPVFVYGPATKTSWLRPRATTGRCVALPKNAGLVGVTGIGGGSGGTGGGGPDPEAIAKGRVRAVCGLEGTGVLRGGMGNCDVDTTGERRGSLNMRMIVSED